MATYTYTHTIVAPVGGASLAGKRGTVRLVASTTAAGAMGHVTGSRSVFGEWDFVLDATGTWTLLLEANSQITSPANTVYVETLTGVHHRQSDPLYFNATPGGGDITTMIVYGLPNMPPITVGPAGPAGSPVAGSNAWLIVYAANPDQIVVGAITRDADGAALSAAVVWPDGSPGTYTATTVSTAFPGAVDAYTVTYGSPVTKTTTQPLVTRDATTGAVTIRPALTVA